MKGVLMAKKTPKKTPKEYNPYIRSFQLNKNMYDTFKSLTELEFPFPLGEPRSKMQTIRWLEFSLAWFIGAALRQEISNEQVDNCVSPNDVLSLWLAFCEAKRGTKGYGFTTEEQTTRRVTVPEGKDPERMLKFGKI